MSVFLLVGWIAVLVGSYKLSVRVLDKIGLLED